MPHVLLQVLCRVCFTGVCNCENTWHCQKNRVSGFALGHKNNTYKQPLALIYCAREATITVANNTRARSFFYALPIARTACCAGRAKH